MLLCFIYYYYCLIVCISFCCWLFVWWPLSLFQLSPSYGEFVLVHLRKTVSSSVQCTCSAGLFNLFYDSMYISRELISMVTQKMLRTYEGKQVFFEKTFRYMTAFNISITDHSAREHLFLNNHMIYIPWYISHILWCNKVARKNSIWQKLYPVLLSPYKSNIKILKNLKRQNWEILKIKQKQRMTFSFFNLITFWIKVRKKNII